MRLLWSTHVCLLTFIGMFALFFFTLHTPAHAQSMMGVGGDAQLVVEPNFPKPQSTVRVSLDAYSINTTGATISWIINDTGYVDGKNERSITIPTGAIGESIRVHAVLSMPGRAPRTLETTINVTGLDIIAETHTYVPPFYRGRALPSAGAPVTLIALPFGLSVPAESLTYKWTAGGSVLFGGPISGKNRITYTMPQFGRDTLVSVTVYDAKGTSLAQTHMNLRTENPELHFYEENPLRGLSNQAVGRSFTLVGDEATIHGIPYYMSVGDAIINSSFTWTVGGVKSPYANPIPNTITLRKTGGGGSSRVELTALSGDRMPQYVNGEFTINF